MAYRIFETAAFRDDFLGISSSVRSKIESKLRVYVYSQLCLQPHFGPNIRKLKDWKPETWRYRIGPWRFFYEINERQKVVFMTSLKYRKDAY